MKVLVAQSCLTLCDPMDCSLPGSSVRARIREWVAISFPMKVVQSCLTLFDPMDYTVHGILQAKILEWIAVPFSRGLNPGLPHCRWILYQLSHHL